MTFHGWAERQVCGPAVTMLVDGFLLSPGHPAACVYPAALVDLELKIVGYVFLAAVDVLARRVVEHVFPAAVDVPAVRTRKVALRVFVALLAVAAVPERKAVARVYLAPLVVPIVPAPQVIALLCRAVAVRADAWQRAFSACVHQGELWFDRSSSSIRFQPSIICTVSRAVEKDVQFTFLFKR